MQPWQSLPFCFGILETYGAMISFGFTLLIGNVFNFICGVGTSKIMLKSLSRFEICSKQMVIWIIRGGWSKCKKYIISNFLKKETCFLLYSLSLFYTGYHHDIREWYQHWMFNSRAVPSLRIIMKVPWIKDAFESESANIPLTRMLDYTGNNGFGHQQTKHCIDCSRW